MKLGKVSDVLRYLEESKIQADDEVTPEMFRDFIDKRTERLDLKSYMIYSPRTDALRRSDRELPVEPLGTNGEGLLKLLKVCKAKNHEKMAQIKKELGVIDWFEDMDIRKGGSEDENLRMRDRYMDESLPFLSHRDINEGFLFLLFYITLFVTRETPSFFAAQVRKKISPESSGRKTCPTCSDLGQRQGSFGHP